MCETRVLRDMLMFFFCLFFVVVFLVVFVFFFNDTATTEIYTLSLHDALPISLSRVWAPRFLILPLVVFLKV